MYKDPETSDLGAQCWPCQVKNYELGCCCETERNGRAAGYAEKVCVVHLFLLSIHVYSEVRPSPGAGLEPVGA